MSISENIKRIKSEIPSNVKLVAATKTRTIEEINEAIRAGITIIGENYVQEALKKYEKLNLSNVELHLIGHLQKNKINKALKIFDCIQSIDSYELAEAIDKRAKKIIPVFIEVNIADEETKFGVKKEYLIDLIKKISQLKNIRVEGLMTMPYFDDPNDARPYFREMKALFEKIRLMNLPNVFMKYLSMGMSNDYKIAIEEGSNMIRIGTAIFGPRKY